MSRRTLSAVGRQVVRADHLSSAFAAARWWLTGQMPHRRCTMTGISQ